MHIFHMKDFCKYSLWYIVCVFNYTKSIFNGHNGFILKHFTSAFVHNVIFKMGFSSSFQIRLLYLLYIVIIKLIKLDLYFFFDPLRVRNFPIVKHQRAAESISLQFLVIHDASFSHSVQDRILVHELLLPTITKKNPANSAYYLKTINVKQYAMTNFQTIVCHSCHMT